MNLRTIKPWSFSIIAVISGYVSSAFMMVIGAQNLCFGGMATIRKKMGHLIFRLKNQLVVTLKR